MKARLAVLLIPALIPLACVIHTAMSRSSYDLQCCYKQSQYDFVLKEGNLHFISFTNLRGKDRIDFSWSPLWPEGSRVHLFSFTGDAPSFQKMEAAENTMAVVGSKIYLASFPVWIVSVVLLIPFIVYTLRYYKK